MIGYVARMGYGPLSVRVAETMHWRPGEPAVPSRTALGGDLPRAAVENIAWSNSRLDSAGWWHPVMPALPAMILHEESAGWIEWSCCCPAARSSVSLAGHHFAGLGYAERLVMTLPAARLPLRELHWGRFITDTQSCVWVRWLGPVERSWCFHNGRPVALTAPDPRQLAWNGHRLELAGGTVLRCGRVGDSVLPDARWLRRMLPAVVRDLAETKWCSAGLLIDAQGGQHAGWAIHEVVRFS
jgi:hypothetical protein